ncbi:MAG: alpha/beta hydrolase-fold protein [Edaphocola sp.]
MQENYTKWFSPIIGRDFEMLTYGHGGVPVIVFPSSMGKYYEAKDRGLVDSVAWYADNGLAKFYCVDSIDKESWYNKGVHPGTRAWNHVLYDRLILEDVVGRARYETGHDRVVTAGCSFGGYHAANFGLKHPELTRAIISMSGTFNIRPQVPGYYDDNVYYNNPEDFLPGDNNPWLWQLKVFLGVGQSDICWDQNMNMSRILADKNMNQWLDIRPGIHDWPLWLEMFPHYLSLI